MSRIGKKTIKVLDGVEIKIDGQKVSCKGPKGELSLVANSEVKVEVNDGKIKMSVAKGREFDKNAKTLWGTTWSLVNNMIIGVAEGFTKKLEIQGVGYTAQVNGRKIVLKMGFSQPVEMEAPEGIELKVEKNIILVSGIDKVLVGQVAARIREVKKPEPYKGKGIRYIDEYVRKKAGKKAVASEE